MRKILLLGAVFLFLALPARGQTQTQVSGCITDPNSFPYAGGQVLINLVPTGGPAPTVNNGPIQGTFGPTPLDSNGCFQASLWPNGAISPAGTKWQFTVSNPGAQPPVGFGPVSFAAAPITIVGATQSVTAALTAAAVKLWNNSSGGSSVSITAASPIVVTPSPIVGTGVISCPTCTVGGGGFGFATGAIVENSTGDTPTNGFTLSDGTNTTTEAPTEILMTNPGNPGVIDINSNVSNFITVGNQATIGASTRLGVINPFQIISENVAAGSSASLGANGEMQVLDASGNQGTIGLPNGAGLTLNGPAGISIVCDGTVPICTLDDGTGDTTQVFADEVFVTSAAGDTGTFDSTEMLLSGSAGNTVTLTTTGGTSVMQVVDSTNAVSISPEAQTAGAGGISIGATHQTTVGAAGGASPLPALPDGYLIINVEGTTELIPYYAAP